MNREKPSPSSRRRAPKHRRRYDLFLNPYDEMGVTRCPTCEQKTRLRKFPLVIHIEPATMFVLNKTCRLCPYCELLVVHRREVEPLLAGAFAERKPEVVGNDYVLVGTLERCDWRAVSKGELSEAEAAERVILFRKHLDFEVRGGWGPAEG